MFSLNNHKSREILENGNHGFMFFICVLFEV